MTRPIDEKLVVMRMDNSDFKSKAKETTSIFDKLKQTFQNIKTGNLNSVSKDLSGISKAANSVDMTSLGRSVDQVASRFSTLGVVATTALATITNKAVNAGMQLSQSLGMGSVVSGFSEYETKIGAIKTVLSNTEWAGTNLDDVKKSLQDLNEYADQTIYNFAEMTKNVGRFTAAGATLEDSVVAIKGMGNLAAVSGAQGEQLNRAMYQVSQALAGGYFQLMDWNSIEEASMGGKKTKDALMETAAEMGVAIDKSKTFRESLKDGWLTSEVFLATMKKFGEDQSMVEAATTVRTFTQLMDNLKESVGSGWATSWEIIFGDYEEATYFWSYISDAIGGVFAKMTEARNLKLSTIFGDGGTITILQTIVNILTPIRKVVGAIGEAWRETFPSDGGAGIRAFIENFENLTSKLDLSEGSFNAIKTIFTALFQALKLGGNIVIGFAGAFSQLFPAVGAIAGGILSLIGYVFKIPATFGKAATSGDGLSNAFSFLGDILSKVSDVIVYLIGGLSNLGSIAASALGVLFSGNYTNGPWSDDSTIVKWLTGIHDAFSSLFNFLGKFSFEAVTDGIRTFFDWLVSGAANIKNVLSGIGEWIAGLSDMFVDNQGWILAGGGLAGLAAVLWKVWEVISAFSKPLAGFGEILENAGESLQAFTFAVHARSILVIAVAVGVLAGAFMLMSNLNATQISTGLYAIAGSLGTIVGSLILLSRYSKEMAVGSVQIVAISVAVIALANAVQDLGAMGVDQLKAGVISLTVVLGALAGTVILISSYAKQMMVGSIQIVAIAGAVALIATAMTALAKIEPEGIKSSLLTVGALLAGIALFARVASSSSASLVTGAAGILAIGGAVIIMVQAIKMINNVDQDVINNGLLNIAKILGVIAAFAISVAKTKIGTASASIALMAAALTLMIVPIQQLGTMKLEHMTQGLAGVVTMLTAMAIASNAMKTAIGGAVSIAIMAAALNLLVVPIAALGALPWYVLLGGIVALGAGLAVLAGVSLALAPAAIPMLGFGLAIAALGAGMALFGKGLIVMTGLTVAAVTTFVAAAGALITGAISLLPAFMDLVQKVINGILDTIQRNGPAILDKINEIILMILDKIIEHGPAILEKVEEVIIMIVDFLVGMIPKLVEVIYNMMIELMQVLTEKIPEFAQAATDLIEAYLDAMSAAIPKVIDAGYQFMIDLINGLTETVQTKGPELIDAFLNLMGEVVKVMITAGLSVIDALFGWIPGVKEATTAIGQNAYNYIDENFKAKDLAGQKGTEFSEGIYQASPLAEEAAKAMAEAGVAGAEGVDVSTAGTSFGEGFATGMSTDGVFTKVKNAAKNLATAAFNKLKETLDINSPSKETMSLGDSAGKGFAMGIDDKAPDVRKAISGYKKEVTTGGKEVTKEASKQGTTTGKSAVEGVSKGVKQTTPKAKKTVAKSSEDLAKTMKDKFKQEMDDAEYKFEMGELDADGYIAELNRIKQSYSKYGDLVKEVNLEIKKVEEEVAKAREEQRKAEFQALKTELADKKYYKQLDLMDELRRWEIARKAYEEGTEERKEADKEVFRIKNEINQKLLDLNEEYIGKIEELNDKEIEQIQEVEDAYQDAFVNRVDALTNFAGIFEEVVKDEEITGGQLLANLKSQFTALEQWTKDIQSLASRGLDEGLLGTLQDMGPSAASEISALNSLTDSQLAEYAEIWRAKNELARTQATKELEGLRQETDLKITQIREDSAAQLDVYKNEWIRRIKEIKQDTTDTFVTLNSDMNVIAQNAMDGLKIGLESKRGEVMAVAQSIADQIVATINAALQVNSPSRKLMWTGEWAGEGLAIGLDNSTSSVLSSATGLAETVNTAMNNVLTDGVLPEIDTEIKVRAIVEYDNKDLESIGLNPNVDFANSVLASTSKPKLQNDDNISSKQVSSEGKTINIEQKLEFHSREMTPSEVARKNLQSSRQLVAQLTNI